MTADHVWFGMRTGRASGALVIEFHGELDLFAWQELWPELESALFLHRSSEFVVDLRPVTFLDASGMRLLLRVHRQAARGGQRARLILDSDRLLRVLRLVGFDQLFDVIPVLSPDPCFPGDAGLGGLPDASAPAG